MPFPLVRNANAHISRNHSFQKPLHNPPKQIKQLPNPPSLRICLVTNWCVGMNRSLFRYKLSRAIQGGVNLVQVRQKHDRQNLRNTAKDALELAQEYASSTNTPRVPVIVNDDLEVAREVGADGLHTGQTDVHPDVARSILGKNAIIGYTVESFDQVIAANKLGVSYLGVQVFPSITKSDSKKIWTLEEVRKIKEISKHRLVAIGGINLDNLDSLKSVLDLSEDRDGVAMIGSIWRTPDPSQATKNILSKLKCK